MGIVNIVEGIRRVPTDIRQRLGYKTLSGNEVIRCVSPLVVPHRRKRKKRKDGLGDLRWDDGMMTGLIRTL